MPYEFVLHRLPEVTVLAIRARVDEAGFPGYLGAAFPELFTHTGSHGIVVTGHPFVIYHAFGPEAIDAEVCVPVVGPAPEAGRISARTLPAETVVRTLHVGPYDELGRAYAALEAWVADHGYASAGPHRERYLNGPDATSSPADYQTEIDLPVVAVEAERPVAQPVG